MDAGPKQDLWNILPVIIVLLLGAAYFAVMETAFASASRIRLKAAADHGNRRAEQALYVLDHFDQAITTLLIGTNILHLTIATLVTVAVQRQWGMWAVTAGTLVTTVVVFFAGEMLPKSIAKKYAERLAMRTARSLRFFMVLFKPLSALLTAFGNAVARRVQSEPAVTVTEDELADIIENMTDDGELTAERGELMSSALSFADVPVESVITARVDVAAVDVDDPPEEILAYVREQRHSRLPVYEGSIDNIIGVLYLNHYFMALLDDPDADLRKLLMEPCYVYKTTKLPAVLETLKRAKQHLAIVTDEYGGCLGLITMEDVLEQIVGDIWDETDEIENEVVERTSGEYELDGDMAIDDFTELVGLDDEAFETESATVGGWTLEMFGTYPQEGQSFKYENLTVTVLKMDGLRVEKVLVQVHPEKKDDEG